MGTAGVTLQWIGLLGAIVMAVRPTTARGLAPTVAAALTGAASVLGVLLWRLDLSYVYVADHARGDLAAPYRLAGLWGGASGSLLMFTAMLATVVAVSQRLGANDWSLRWGAATVGILTTTTIWFSDPFERLRIPAIAGVGLQPILEHPAMLYHPPILYAGLVATFVPWAVTVGAAKLDDTWRHRARTSVAVAFALITLGQVTGANWAYVELGWGGYWGWDPVENGVLVTWLLLLAALHLIGQPAPGRLVASLVAAPWISVLVAVAVTRAGVGGSVHAFANDERTTWMLLGAIAITIATTAVSIRRLPRAPLGRRLALVGAGSATCAAAVVLEGVLYPIPAPGEPLVSGHFYATLIGPLAVATLAACSLALGRPKPWWLAAGMVGAVVVARVTGATTAFALAVAAGVGAVIVGFGSDWRLRSATRWSTRLGHAGIAVLLIGVAGSTQGHRVTVSLPTGSDIEIGGVVFTHRSVGVEPGPAPRSNAVVAVVEAADGGRTTTLRPSLVAFEERGVLLAEAALDSRPRRDVQVVLRSATDGGVARYDIAVTPLVQPVWWGALTIALAGAMIVWDQLWSRRRSRVRSSKAETVAESSAADASSSA